MIPTVMVVVAVMFTLREVGRIGGTIAAAELVFSTVDNGHANVGGPASEGVGVVLVEMEHEVAYGFAGKFSSLEHHMKVKH